MPSRVNQPVSREPLDLQWFRTHLLEGILPCWLRHAVTQTGYLHPHLDQEWQPTGKRYASLVSQTRLIYNFCVGYELTRDPAYRQALEAGTHFLAEHFWDPKHGGWFSACNPDGSTLREEKDCYGHAFAIFALAHVTRITGEKAWREAATKTWELLQTHFQDSYGGFTSSMTRDFQERSQTKSQNPLMHLFEALLALGDLEGMESIHRDAQRVSDFVVGKLCRQSDRRLPENYSLAWEELPEEEDGKLDLGHAFEWAYLLSSAVERGLPEAYLTQAEAFLDYGLLLAYDPDDGGIRSPASPDGQRVASTKGWWEQCEAIRALMHFAILRGRRELVEPLQHVVDFVKLTYVDPTHGGWYASSSSRNKGSEWKVDYHVVGMCREAIRLLEQAHPEGR